MGFFVTLDRMQIHEEVTDADAVERLIRRFPMEEIWMSETTEYPCLAIQTNGVHACAHYFQAHGEMWMSLGTEMQNVAFYAGGELWEAPADAVISLDDAINCGREYFQNRKRPACIQWQEM